MITGIHHVSMKCGTQEEFDKAKDFYLNILGFSVKREWPEGIMIDSGCGLLEIFCNGAGIKEKGAVRHIAFSTDDVDGIIEKVRKAGYEVFIEPNDIVISSSPALHARMAFCKGALGEEIEFFQELDFESNALLSPDRSPLSSSGLP
ncbi:MAG: VOC family protein [Treponema sp.]|nr:VOC family protein [Treponema sp.]